MNEAPRLRVLITGFGPFPGVPENASATLVESIGHTAPVALPEIDVTAAVLPTEWQHAENALDAHIAAGVPDAVVMFGVSPQAAGFVLERLCTNRCDGRADAANVARTVGELLTDGPATCETRLPVAEIAAVLKSQNLPVAYSDDPGRYLCNAIMYHALVNLPAHVRAGFIHIPQSYPDTYGGPLPDELPGAYAMAPEQLRFVDTLAGALTVLRVVANNATETSRPQR